MIQMIISYVWHAKVFYRPTPLDNCACGYFNGLCTWCDTCWRKINAVCLWAMKNDKTNPHLYWWFYELSSGNSSSTSEADKIPFFDGVVGELDVSLLLG